MALPLSYNKPVAHCRLMLLVMQEWQQQQQQQLELHSQQLLQNSQTWQPVADMLLEEPQWLPYH
jgi:aminoglycoside/choline kinase family phosphotransferase